MKENWQNIHTQDTHKIHTQCIPKSYLITETVEFLQVFDPEIGNNKFHRRNTWKWSWIESKITEMKLSSRSWNRLERIIENQQTWKNIWWILEKTENEKGEAKRSRVRWAARKSGRLVVEKEEDGDGRGTGGRRGRIRSGPDPWPPCQDPAVKVRPARLSCHTTSRRRRGPPGCRGRRPARTQPRRRRARRPELSQRSTGRCSAWCGVRSGGEGGGEDSDGAEVRNVGAAPIWS